MRIRRVAFWILTGLLAQNEGLRAQATFVRGEVNSGSGLEIGDAILIKDVLFGGQQHIACHDAADVDDTGTIDIIDIVRILNYLFRGGFAPRPPYPLAGADPSADDLSCGFFISETIGRNPQVTIGFECPTSVVEGIPGSTMEIEAFATLRLRDDLPQDTGIQAWSLGVSVSQAEILEATLEGLTVDTFFDHDTSSNTPRTGPHPIELAGTPYNVAELAAGDAHGAVSAVVLELTRTRTLRFSPVVRVLRLVLSFTVPAAEETIVVSLQSVPGIQGRGQPVRNIVTDGTLSTIPHELGCNFQVRGVAPPVHFIRGDANDNGKVNLADAVWILNHLFRGGPASACWDSENTGTDSSVNANDAIHIINHYMRVGPPPYAPYPECGPAASEEPSACPDGSRFCNP